MSWGSGGGAARVCGRNGSPAYCTGSQFGRDIVMLGMCQGLCFNIRTPTIELREVLEHPGALLEHQVLERSGPVLERCWNTKSLISAYKLLISAYKRLF